MNQRGLFLFFIGCIFGLQISSCTTYPVISQPQPTSEATKTNLPSISTPKAAPLPTRTQTSTSTSTATIVPTATQTEAPAPTKDAPNAAQVEWAKAQVGDQLRDWITIENYTTFDGHSYRRFRVNIIYEGVNEELAGTKISGLVDGKEQEIGEVVYGFKGKMLVGDEFKDVNFVWFYKDYSTGKVYRIGRGGISDPQAMQKPELAAERTGFAEMNAIPGRLTALFITEPGQAPVNDTTARFNTAFWGANQEKMVTFLETGENSLGFVLPFDTVEECEASVFNTYPESCYPKGAPIIMPGFIH